MADANDILSIKKRIKTLSDKKVGAEKERELLKKSYAELVAKLNALGVEDVKSLPTVIQDLKAEAQTLQEDIEQKLAAAESIMKG